MFGVPVKRLAAVTGGAVLAKAANAPIGGILQKVLPNYSEAGSGRMLKVILSGGKIFLGAYANQKMKNQMVQDAGLGVMMVGGLELLEEFVPQLNIAGINIFDDYENIGEVVEIDLNRLNGPQVYNSLEDYQEVAGVQSYAAEMELAGVEAY